MRRKPRSNYLWNSATRKLESGVQASQYNWREPWSHCWGPAERRGGLQGGVGPWLAQVASVKPSPGCLCSPWNLTAYRRQCPNSSQGFEKVVFAFLWNNDFIEWCSLSFGQSPKWDRKRQILIYHTEKNIFFSKTDGSRIRLEANERDCSGNVSSQNECKIYLMVEHFGFSEMGIAIL